MDVFVARQPIFDVRQKIFGYELLFRSSINNFYDRAVDGDYATKKLVSDSFLVFGADTLTKGKRAFVNFTRNLLLSAAPSDIPKDLIAVEILESIVPDDEVVSACKKLKQAGYIIVLDDFIFYERYRSLVELADIIKVDFIQTKGDERRAIIRTVNNNNVKFLAEKVESGEEFQEALNLGYVYFQGYFFSKPTIISGKDIPGQKLNYIRVLQEINRPEVEFEKISAIMARDVSLAYKLLKFVNSAFFSRNVKVESIKHALVLMGIQEIKKWVNLVALDSIGYDKPQELVVIALIRAQFCELTAVKTGLSENGHDYFLLGLFSVLDALVDRPMEEILSELPISDDIKSALMGADNTLHDVYCLALAYEKGDWAATSEYARKLQIAEADLPDMYFRSVQWANAVF